MNFSKYIALLSLGLSLSLSLGSILPLSASFAAPAPETSSVMSFEKFQELEASLGKSKLWGQSQSLFRNSDSRLELSMDSHAVTTSSTDPNCGKGCESLRQEFRYVVYVGKQIYCYWDMKKVETRTDFDALANSLEASITNDSTKTSYFLALRTWASAFHDGHVNAIASEDMSQYEIYTAPVRLEVIAPATSRETVVVVASSHSDVSVGDEVLAIDGLPIAKAIDQAEKQVSGSTRRMRRFFATRRLVDVTGIDAGTKTLQLELSQTAAGGQKKTVELYRDVSLAAAPSRGTAPSAPAATGLDNFKSVQILPGQIGYLRVDGFGGSQSSALLAQAMERLSKTKALVIDMRKNGGGDQSGNEVLKRLAKKQITRYTISPRMSDILLAARPDDFITHSQWKPGTDFAPWKDLTVDPVKTNSYAGKPVFVRTSANCFSACDTFVSALKMNGLATVIGEGTGGGTGSPHVFELPVSNGAFRYSVVRGKTAVTGDAIEGAGTLPDVVLEPTLIDRLQKKDTQLMKAVEKAILATGGSMSPMQAAELSRQLETVTPIWDQRLDLAPTFQDELELRRISAIDEL